MDPYVRFILRIGLILLVSLLFTVPPLWVRMVRLFQEGSCCPASQVVLPTCPDTGSMDTAESSPDQSVLSKCAR